MNYVEWESISTGVFMAKSSSVMSVEECPLCKTAMSTEPDDFGEIQCLSRHVFVIDDDGANYTASHVDSIPRRVSTKWAMVDGAYVANLNSDLIGCPRCQRPIDLSEIAIKDERGAFYSTCSSGHEFDAYIRIPHIWLYEAENGPFTTWERQAA